MKDEARDLTDHNVSTGWVGTVPYASKGWRLRYLTWSLGREGHPFFPPGSIVLHTWITEGKSPMLWMVWMEPVPAL